MANRYVNTASTAGGDGTTNATTGANRAWADLAEAANALGSSLSTPIDIYCEGSAADTSNVDQTVWDFTTTATNKLRVIGEQSPLHPNFSTAKSGKYDTSLYHITATNRNGLYNNIPEHIECHGIQVHVTVTNGGSYIGMKLANGNQDATDISCVIAHCIIKATETSGDVTGVDSRPPATGGRGTSLIYNCLSIDCNQGYTNDFGLSGDVGKFYNCTAAGGVYGFVEAATMKVVNCLATGCSTSGFVGTFASGSDYNAEDDGGGAPGAHSRSSQTFTFIDAASDDFHLASTDAGAKGYGTADPSSGVYDDDIDGETRGATWDIGFDQYIEPPIEQEGFRWGVDDGSESAHTWEATQDTDITIADNQTRLLRVLINAVGSDPAATAYTLRAQKNGSGGYTAVPIGSGTSPTLSYGATGTIAYSSSGGSSVAPTYPTGITANSALVLVVGQKPSSANGGTVTTPSGWTLQAQNTGATDGDTGGYTTTLGADTGNCNIYVYTKDTVSGSESGTLSVTVGTNGVCWANIYRVEASAAGTWSYAGSVGKDTSAGNVSIATGSMAIASGDYVLAGMVIPTDVTTPSQFSAEALAQSGTTFGTVTEIQEPDSTTGNDIGGFLVHAPVSAGSGSGAVTLTATAGGTTTNVRGPGFVLRLRIAGLSYECYVGTSANITAGGEATTARLTAPSGKSTSDFVTGRRWDDENGTDTINITSDDYTEVEWLVALSSAPVDTDYFEFRVYAGATALYAYTLTPKWTVGTGGGGAASRQSLMMMGMGR